MIDQDEYDAYEEWKSRKLAGATDLTVSAFNTEMEATALAWEKGVKDVFKRLSDNPDDARALDSLLELNPYRKFGMNGFRKQHTPSGPGIGDGPGGVSMGSDQARRVISPPQGILRSNNEAPE